MASLQLRGESWSCIFCYRGKREWLTLGKIPLIDAEATKARVEYLLRLLKQKLITVPPGSDIVTFMQNDGKPPDGVASAKDEVTLGGLRDSYLRVHSNGTLEKTTLDGITQHFKHWAAILGDKFPMQKMALSDLQQYVDRRSKMKGKKGLLSPATVKKEIVTLRTAWNWAVQFGLVTGKFPQRGLRYPRSEEKPPFMTWDEIDRQIAAGGDPDHLWECLYLRTNEISELLAYVREHAYHSWIYPFYCFAAYTGARRSEIMRTLVADVDLASKTITLREKKRVRGKDSTRRVPMTPFMQQTLEDWLKIHPGGPHLFCQAGVVERSRKRSKTTGYVGDQKRASNVKERMKSVREREPLPTAALTRNEVRDHVERALGGSKWNVIKGLHCLRHSYISALANAGVDQRIIQDICGHMTDEMQKRYALTFTLTQNTMLFRVFSVSGVPWGFELSRSNGRDNLHIDGFQVLNLVLAFFRHVGRT